jgi:hypothetical protein
MKNKPMWIVLVFVLICIVLYFSLSPRVSAPTSTVDTTTTATAFDPKNATYTIEGQPITLVNGKAESKLAAISVSKVITSYFGNEAVGDLNGDGTPDRAYLITQSTGGSGLFYYAVVALKKNDGYIITNAFLVGDRIAPQSTEINVSAKELHVNFAERKVGEPVTTPPSVGAVLLLKVTPDNRLTGLMQ